MKANNRLSSASQLEQPGSKVGGDTCIDHEIQSLSKLFSFRSSFVTCATRQLKSSKAFTTEVRPATAVEPSSGDVTRLIANSLLMLRARMMANARY